MAGTVVRRRSRSVPARVRETRMEDPLDEEVDGILHGRFYVLWQVYLAAWKVWASYTPEQSKRIEAAWQAMATTVDVGWDADEEEGWPVHLVRMTQWDPHSETSHPVMRILVTHK